MKLTVEQYAEALYEALQEAAPKDHTKVIDNFIRVLSANNDISRYEKIITAYEQVDRERRGVKQVELTFARDIEANAGLMDKLNVIAGSDIEVKTKMDSGLIGGVVVKIDDTLIDASVQAQLNRLKNDLSH